MSHKKIIYETQADAIGCLLFIAVFILYFIYLGIPTYDSTLYSAFWFFMLGISLILVVRKACVMWQEPSPYQIRFSEHTLEITKQFLKNASYKKKDITRFFVQNNSTVEKYDLLLQYDPTDSNGKYINKNPDNIEISSQDYPVSEQPYILDGKNIDINKVALILNTWVDEGRSTDVCQRPVGATDIAPLKKNESTKINDRLAATGRQPSGKIKSQENTDVYKIKKYRAEKEADSKFGLHLLLFGTLCLIISLLLNYYIFEFATVCWNLCLLVGVFSALAVLIGLIMTVVPIVAPVKVVTRHKTLFQERADVYQKKQCRTKNLEIKESLSILGVNILLLIITVALNHYIFEFATVCWNLCLLVGVFSALTFLIGLIRTVVSIVAPVKVVTCPGCSTEHRIYKSVRQYMCTNCRMSLLMIEKREKRLRLSVCPYCRLQTAVSYDFGCFDCSNCGVLRGVSAKEVKGEGHRSCPECKAEIPKEALYCKSCGCILNIKRLLDLACDMDWKIGKDAVGHLVFARMLLQALRQDSAIVNDIQKVQSRLTMLEDALVSVEEAYQKPGLHSAVKRLLPEVDMVYTDLLESELSCAKAIDPENEYLPYRLNTIMIHQPHIVARKRVEKMPGISLESSGSIGKWRGRLMHPQRITDYRKLQNEASRFAAWREQRILLHNDEGPR